MTRVIVLQVHGEVRVVLFLLFLASVRMPSRIMIVPFT